MNEVFYTLDMQRLEHILCSNGRVVRFDITGKWLGVGGYTNSLPSRLVDVISVIQQGESIEAYRSASIGVAKRRGTLTEFNKWLQGCPTNPIATLSMKRKTEHENFLQVLYVYPSDTFKAVTPFV